jgi:hypothetical protein
MVEDWAYCDRARCCGYRIMADTTIRVWHLGTYAYGWEDAGIELPRHQTLDLRLDCGAAIDARRSTIPSERVAVALSDKSVIRRIGQVGHPAKERERRASHRRRPPVKRRRHQSFLSRLSRAALFFASVNIQRHDCNARSDYSSVIP